MRPLPGDPSLLQPSAVIRLQLAIDGGDPVTGMLTVEGGDPRRFCGWIDLMAAVTESLASGLGPTRTTAPSVGAARTVPGDDSEVFP